MNASRIDARDRDVSWVPGSGTRPGGRGSAAPRSPPAEGCRAQSHGKLPSPPAASRPEVHWQCAPSPSLHHVQADVRSDPIQPRAQPASFLEALQSPPCPHEGVLHCVLGVLGGPEHPIAIGG